MTPTVDQVRSEWAEQYRQWEKACRRLESPALTAPEREATKRTKAHHGRNMDRLEMLMKAAHA